MRNGMSNYIDKSVFVGLRMPKAIVGQLDLARSKVKMSRSTFIRRAIIGAIEAAGVDISGLDAGSPTERRGRHTKAVA
jgi:predicted transcriptional regulator